MEAMHIKAEWYNDHMDVSLTAKGHLYSERMLRDRWDEFVAKLDTVPLEIGGMKLVLAGNKKQCSDTEVAIKNYFRMVNKSFKKHGHTNYLEP